ncbi:diaminopimelate dehydrogenase [Paenibacillus sp. YPG26]|uniref:diaminopimelate dehydrogenase n=1 Tax=Paenibacillus sp. YPG26 TaxID=2878915 RepID=UPI00203D424F|nr:diaminopimelate dehydrogenase [Paenibacillus sp. YPG26]USB33174.1 diaminopimelate dehydrogenase [Paenibacillus sp. YPG26]
MTQPISIGIVGYGNLGRGVEAAIRQNPDLRLEAIFTRRDPQTLESGTQMVSINDIESYKGKIDVLILCGGSATDLPEQGPALAKLFHTVDSFDTHARIPEYYEEVQASARTAGTVSVISTGWDPGLFSLNRLLAEAVLPEGNEFTFWGKGVSQGHSDAIRRVQGVKNGIQYTIPREEAVARVRSGENPELSTRDKHLRECYVVAEEGADREAIAETIRTMPNYFADYETVVHFVSEETLAAEHGTMPHGGHVIRSGRTGEGNTQIIEFGLKLDSNPEFTASVLVAYARAAYRLAQKGESGAYTVFDIPFGLLSPKSPEQLRKELL